MNTTSTKQLSAPQRAKIAAQCDAVQSAAAALSFQWATIKSYRGWSARFTSSGSWLDGCGVVMGMGFEVSRAWPYTLVLTMRALDSIATTADLGPV